MWFYISCIIIPTPYGYTSCGAQKFHYHFNEKSFELNLPSIFVEYVKTQLLTIQKMAIKPFSFSLKCHFVIEK